MSQSRRLGVCAAILLGLMLVVPPLPAQSQSPPAAPAVTTPATTTVPAATTTPASTTTPAKPLRAFCNESQTGTRLTDGSVTMAVKKNWQPVDGSFTFTIAPAAPLPADTRLIACLTWKRDGAQAVEAPVDISKAAANGAITVAVTVPRDFSIPSGWLQGDTDLFVVPLADLRIIGVSQGNIVVDVSHVVGITHQLITFLLSLAIILLLVGWMTKKRPTTDGAKDEKGPNWIYRLIGTRSGKASLSQFQVMLWTIVVAFSSVYVMLISGALVDISSSTLVLLGIAGGATLLAKVSPTPSDAAAPDPNAPRSLFIDLVGGGAEGEVIDVTRLQMLIFTVISAGFVLANVLTTYEIPSIPEGYLILMGLSNTVYIGSKNLPAKPAAANPAPNPQPNPAANPAPNQ